MYRQIGMNYIIALLMTIFFELLFAFLWGVPRRDWKLLIYVNVFTNPLANLAHRVFYSHGFLLHTLLPELWVILVEIWYYHKKENDIPYPTAFAICVNVFSFLIGVLVNEL
ncbi:MAG: hypothetical protein LIO86_03195 [Lachnospiraceae bacterium]|nr:hypothetical protein [Lachnospiraceae bacterium]